jgi:hypothetical protein
MIAKDGGIDVATSPVGVASGAEVDKCDVCVSLCMHLGAKLVNVIVEIAYDDVGFWLRRKGRECATDKMQCVGFVLRSIQRHKNEAVQLH